jgi:gas vesicle protein
MIDPSNNNVETYTGNAGGNLFYLLAGCGIGATLALLFAPKPGRELRGDISEVTRKSYDETLEFAQELKDHSAELYGSMRSHADKVYDLAAAKLQLAETAIEEAQNSPRDLVNGEVGRKAGRASQKSAVDRPSNIF